MFTGLRNIIRKTGFDIVRARSLSEYNIDGLHSVHNHDFENDQGFRKAYEIGAYRTHGNHGLPGPWRVHLAIWAAQTAMRRGGDFVECGVYLGFVSTVVMTYLQWNDYAGDRTFYLIDNFEGIVPELLTGQEASLGRRAQYGTHYQSTYDRAKQNLDQFRNTIVIKGSVPDVLPSVTNEKIAYLHLDMNSAVPEVAALRYFWPKIVTGGIVLLDDFAYKGYQPQTDALATIAKEIGVSIAFLPTGQGLIVK